MLIDSSKITFLVGDEDVLMKSVDTPVLPMFSEYVINFLSDLSRELLTKENRDFLDITSYAYWIRKASIEKEKEKYVDRNYRLGRGMAFHIAPSNVPINFAVSMTSSLLAGNVTVIRVSNKEYEQVDIICRAINKLLLDKYKKLKNYLCLIRYDHDDDITRKLSSMCDIRIIWGGNGTIEAIRQTPIPPRAIEMTFADRYSFAVINAEEYLRNDYYAIAKGFYTDTYYTDQNACSSPRLVVWMGKRENITKAQHIFWEKLNEIVARDYKMKPIQAVDKYSMFCSFAMGNNGVKIVSDDNLIIRIEVDDLSKDMMEYKYGGGYFFEYYADKIEDILPLLKKECQTVALFGVEKDAVSNLVVQNGVRGVDRIVSVGQTMGLEFVWDGFRMIQNMTRLVYVSSV